MSWQIGFEFGITVLVVLLQLYFFSESYKKILDLKQLFPNYEFDPNYFASQQVGDDEVPLLNDSIKAFHPDFIAMVQTINKYLSNNHGNTDFASVKSIVERKIENKENVISAGISLPLYIGLMGTFFGVCIGLCTIAFFGGVTDENISAFIGGVFIAMIGSFCGLLFTVINNAHNYKSAKALCDSRKNDFFNFMETDLFPHLGSGLFHALELLKTNIQEFNFTFKQNIDLFDTKFADNIKSLVTSVESISENIDEVIANTKSQQEFLAELRNIGHLQMAETNLKAFTMLNKATPVLLEFIEKQKDLSSAVTHAGQFVAVIESILNRVKSFEEGLNNLGENISTKQYLGSEVLIRIDSNLAHLDKQFELLKRHESDTSESLEAFFKNQYQQVQRLTNDIKGEVEQALELKIEKNPLHKLQLLETIDKSLEAIRISLDKKNEEESKLNLEDKKEVPIPPSPPPPPTGPRVETNGSETRSLITDGNFVDRYRIEDRNSSSNQDPIADEQKTRQINPGKDENKVVLTSDPEIIKEPEKPQMVRQPELEKEEKRGLGKFFKNLFNS